MHSDQGAGRECCRPGDIIITPLRSGFRVGRAISGRDEGLWWEYLSVVKSFDTAIREARGWAREKNAQVWLENDDRTYTRIPPDLDSGPPA
jgi:hypothetical protein